MLKFIDEQLIVLKKGSYANVMKKWGREDVIVLANPAICEPTGFVSYEHVAAW